MILTDIRLKYHNIPLKTPFITALRRVNGLESIIVELITDEGLHGYGEAAPTKAITGEDLGSIIRCIETHIKPVLLNQPLTSIEAIMPILHGCCHGNNSAKAAVDIALYDLYSKAEGTPLHAYLGGTLQTLTSDVTISLDTPEKMAEDAARAMKEGLDILKVKVGGRDGKDGKRIKAIRNAAKKATLYIDANQAWGEEEALEIIQAVKDLNIALIEQPVSASALESCAALRHKAPSLSSPMRVSSAMKMP